MLQDGKLVEMPRALPPISMLRLEVRYPFPYTQPETTGGNGMYKVKLHSGIRVFFTSILVFIYINNAMALAPRFNYPITQEAYGYLCELLRIPHGSGNEKAISDHLVAFAKKQGLEVIQDQALNVMIRKPGTAGRENEQPVILQAHMDMVCEKNEDVVHDFFVDPIIPVVDGDWVKAKGTTLGADDASGVSIIMAILAADNLSHPPIEAVLTTSEETDMGGAFYFDTTLLEGKRLINLDSDQEGTLTVSCVSSSTVNMFVPVEFGAVPDGLSTYILVVKGLMGGHSGTDIDKNRANANVLAARLLVAIDSGSLHVTSIHGGSSKNAIPRECKVVLSFAENDFETIKTKLTHAEVEFREEYINETDLTVILEECEPAEKALNDSTLKKIIAGILFTPNGVLSMSSDYEGLVQTSNSLGIIDTGEEWVTLTSYLRSSLQSERELVLGKMNSLADVIGARVFATEQSPTWSYKADSALRDIMIALYEDLYGKAPFISSVHAGLECSIFAERISDVDIVSIGVTIQGAHSPDEQMSLSSFDRTCNFLVMLLERL